MLQPFSKHHLLDVKRNRSSGRLLDMCIAGWKNSAVKKT